MPTSSAVDAYLADCAPAAREKLAAIRQLVHDEVPEAEETISYKIPAFRLDGRYLVYMAGFAHHVSMYPAPVSHPDFEDDMAVYGSGKSTARFPLDEDLPLDLIRRLVRFHVVRVRGPVEARR